MQMINDIEERFICKRSLRLGSLASSARKALHCDRLLAALRSRCVERFICKRSLRFATRWSAFFFAFSLTSQLSTAAADTLTERVSISNDDTAFGASSDRGAASAEKEPKGTGRRRPTIGLAFGGGGTRGTAHIGVIRALEKEGIPIDFIAGTSMGAIVGGLYSAGRTIDEIQELIYNKKLMRAYLTVPIPVRIAVVPVFFLPHLFGYHPYDGLYKGKRFARFISASVPPETRNIENSRIPFCAVASNLLDGKVCALNRGDLGRAVQASSALPFLRRPVEHEGKLLVDGGIVENLPVETVRKMGADIVIAVDVDDDLKHLTFKDFRRIGSATARAINMHLSTVDLLPQQRSDLVIHPDVTGIRLLSTDTKDVDRAIRAGEEATSGVMPVLKRIIKEKSIAAGPVPDAS